MKTTIASVAVIQLRTAIQLYHKGNYISALTLAGAAEEILGKMAAKSGGDNAIQSGTIWLNQFADYLGKPRTTEKVVAGRRNLARNAVKHNDRGEDIEIEFDFKNEAEQLIIDAINNYEVVFESIPNDRVIRRYWNWISL